MKQPNHDASPKRSVSPESREKMSRAKKEWWAKKRRATSTQSDAPTVPVENATVRVNELNPAPDSATSEVPTSASNELHPQRGRAEFLPTGDEGADPGILAGNQGAPSGTKTSSEPSAKQGADNVGNGQLSPGARTTVGKQQSSLNAYKHDIYVKQLYPTTAQWEEDGADYQRLARGIRDHYRPVNYMAEMCAEKLAVYHVLLARITRRQQSYLASKFAFTCPIADRILRARNSIEKAISREIREMERFQANGKVAFGERPEPGTKLWVESMEVIYEGPAKRSGPDSNDRVESKGGTVSPLQRGKSNPIIDYWNQAKTGGPTKGENKPADLLARTAYQVMGLPYPYDEPDVAPSESIKKEPTGE
jgi:hypothetical protein